VFRNVKDFGAKEPSRASNAQDSSSSLSVDSNSGHGATDDTAAINAAINAGGRYGQGCPGPTVTPAVVCPPSGTYILFSSTVEQYYAQIIGNPNDSPVLKATPCFTGFEFIEGNKYYSQDPNWGTTNVFWRQVRKIVFDYSNLPINSSVCGIHWPASQSTSLLNFVFQMSSSSGTQHIGIFSETGVRFNLCVSPNLNTQGTSYLLFVIRLFAKLRISYKSAKKVHNSQTDRLKQIPPTS
jgi:hypothetical protein